MEALLLPSPLLPAAAYDQLVDALNTRGCRTRVADASGAVSGPQLIERWSSVGDSDVPLIAHSNAGYLAPGVRAALGSSQPIVFMDAATPAPEGETVLAPPAFRSQLDELADESGLLPPWTRWWPREQVPIPDSRFAELDASCPRIGLAYLDTTVTAPPDWIRGPNAYLAFGHTYAEELALARGSGWPVEELPGNHLEFLWDPASVAESLIELLSGLLRRAGRQDDD